MQEILNAPVFVAIVISILYAAKFVFDYWFDFCYQISY